MIVQKAITLNVAYEEIFLLNAGVHFHENLKRSFLKIYIHMHILVAVHL